MMVEVERSQTIGSRDISQHFLRRNISQIVYIGEK
jgi:hypothetical protein